MFEPNYLNMERSRSEHFSIIKAGKKLTKEEKNKNLVKVDSNKNLERTLEHKCCFLKQLSFVKILSQESVLATHSIFRNKKLVRGW